MTNRHSITSSWLDYLQLIRLPNVFTAFADIATGFLLGNVTLAPVGTFALLALASGCLYCGGIALNDVHDIEQDRVERPDRPLPSGRIPLNRARHLAYALLASGCLFAPLAGMTAEQGTTSRWQSGCVAILLAGFVYLYDAVAKQTPVGPIAMGLCRTLNILLGASISTIPFSPSFLGFDSSVWTVALGIGTYIAGVTWFAQTEAIESKRTTLAFGLAVMAVGIVTLALFPRTGLYASGNARILFSNQAIWPLLLVLVMFTPFRRGILAVFHPSPPNVQKTVKQCILSLIVLDASVCLAVRGPQYSLIVICLLVPTMFLGKWIYQT